MRQYLVLLAFLTVFGSSAKSESPIDSVTSLILSQIILKNHIEPMDSSSKNASVFTLTTLDTLSKDNSRYALVAFKYDDQGFGIRTTRELVCVFDLSTATPVEVGCFSEGYVTDGNLMAFGNDVLAELTTAYGASGWSQDTYLLVRVRPGFKSEFFAVDLEGFAYMNDMPHSYSFIKLLPDSLGNMSGIMVWQTNTRNDDQTNELLSRRDSVSSYKVEREQGEVRFKQIEGMSQDSLRSLFHSADVPVRYLGRLADSLLKGM